MHYLEAIWITLFAKDFRTKRIIMAFNKQDRTNNVSSLLSPAHIAEVVYDALLQCATNLRPDVYHALQGTYSEQIAADSNQSRQTSILSQLLENADIAQKDNVPLCQDTGTVWICLEIGEEFSVPANVFSLVDDAVARAFTDGLLRMSVVKDALFDRSNTNNNTPAFCEINIVEGNTATLHVLLKGGGSDNASRLVMLSPDAGADGVERFVLDTVREKAANACPPLIIGLGIGATFDKVASLSKHALLREIGSPAQNEEAAKFEQHLLDVINNTSIGPAALGGTPTALAVHLISAPCHIAALPVAINMGCCAMRSVSIPLIKEPTDD